MQFWKDLIQLLSSALAVIVAAFAVFNYYRSRKLEAARWALQLYEKFYEKDALKDIRRILDSNTPNDPSVAKLVSEEPDNFTDYLNFFEFIAFLQFRGQMAKDDVNTLFSYYLGCLRKHPAVYTYVTDRSKGYEQLSQMLQQRA